ncbi:unnamed protein product [Candida verbasci]|uniref:Translation initiation factor eIF2B subunit gamma n=1 Tax=Candida verbasci TaxID=1227364 RepID=A0A9W4TS04_9ASCO|nr:unnamed protein product [Candida verbasci]
MEFTAVILCGKGKELSPFSLSSRSTGFPKAILPIANKPMIEYVIEWCFKGFFAKILLVTYDNEENSINEWLNKYKKQMELNQEYSPSIDILTISNSNSDESGAILYHIYQIQPTLDNFILLPCDFITNLPPQVLIESYRNKNENDLGILFHYRNTLDLEDKVKSKMFNKNYTIYSEIEPDYYNLLDIYSKVEIEKFHKNLKIRSHMLWRYPNTLISCKLLNSNIFIGSNEIFNIFQMEGDKYNETYFKYRPITKIIRDLARRSWSHSKAKETIGFQIIPKEASFLRANNLPVLMEANRYFMKQQKTNRQQEKGSHISSDSIIGNNTTFGEKTNVKKSVIGDNCIIGKKVKINGCLIFNNVVIKDDIQLENCIIGSNVIVNNKSKLVNCNVENENEVIEGTQSKGDTLLCLTLENLKTNEDNVDTTDGDVLYSEHESESDDDSEEESDEEEYHDEFTGNEDGLFAY